MESRETVLRTRKTRPEKAGKQPRLFELKRVGMISLSKKSGNTKAFSP